MPENDGIYNIGVSGDGTSTTDYLSAYGVVTALSTGKIVKIKDD